MANGMTREAAGKQAFGEICYGEKFDDKGVLIPKEVENTP